MWLFCARKPWNLFRGVVTGVSMKQKFLKQAAIPSIPVSRFREGGFELGTIREWKTGFYIKTPKGWKPFDAERGEIVTKPGERKKAENILPPKELIKTNQALYKKYLEGKNNFLKSYNLFKKVVEETAGGKNISSESKNILFSYAEKICEVREGLKNLADKNPILKKDSSFLFAFSKIKDVADIIEDYKKQNKLHEINTNESFIDSTIPFFIANKFLLLYKHKGAKILSIPKFYDEQPDELKQLVENEIESDFIDTDSVNPVAIRKMAGNKRAIVKYNDFSVNQKFYRRTVKSKPSQAIREAAFYALDQKFFKFGVTPKTVYFKENIQNLSIIEKAKDKKEIFIQNLIDNITDEKKASKIESALEKELFDFEKIFFTPTEGSAQEFIEGKDSSEFMTFKNLPPGVKQKMTNQLERIAVLDYVLGNTDRHFGNLRIDNDYNVWAIDNGLTFSTVTSEQFISEKNELHLDGIRRILKDVDENFDRIDNCKYLGADVLERINEVIKRLPEIKEFLSNLGFGESEINALEDRLMDVSISGAVRCISRHLK